MLLMTAVALAAICLAAMELIASFLMPVIFLAARGLRLAISFSPAISSGAKALMNGLVVIFALLIASVIAFMIFFRLSLFGVAGYSVRRALAICTDVWLT